MRHLGSAMLLGILLAMTLILVSWGHSLQTGGSPEKLSFHRTLNQLELIEDQPTQ